jgi:UDP-glucose:(heptosyl)LPS alpha-1,3-glucosyltransferase
VGEEYRRYYRFPEDRILFIPNGVDRERYRPVSDRAALRRELGLPERETLLLFVGHEFKRKGLRLILEGMAQCRSATKPVLVVAGGDQPDAYRASARALGIEARVRFLGLRSDAHRLCAASDLFVFLSNYESFGLVGLEALASGLPVITTRVSGMEDYVEDGENGCFTERSAEGFAATLARVLDDPALLERIRAGARPSTESYAWPEIAERYLEAFERILAGTRNPG